MIHIILLLVEPYDWWRLIIENADFEILEHKSRQNPVEIMEPCSIPEAQRVHKTNFVRESQEQH